MSDVRALLKAKRQEIHVNHPLASYTSSGQLRCIACSTIVKQSSSWDGHVGSKAHRTNAARLKEQQRLREIQEESERKRRAAEKDEEETVSKRQKVQEEDSEDDEAPSHPRAGFPADFFSDPSRAPLPPPSDDESDEVALTVDAPVDAVDLEWRRFQEAVLNAPDEREAYERATVVAEPVLAVESPSGFPPAQTDVGHQVSQHEEVVDQAELRRRREQEERELIMDRLLDEERAQEEADEKVTVLKLRLNALKKQREAARKLKSKSAP
ncbi:hypothetical protein BKA93DRAFT_823264 [Sparassis latifolia]